MKLDLRLRLKKCKFYATEAKVLGSLMTRDGIKMDPLKIKTIRDWPRPIDGKAMQRFMGAANFHRDFSHKFADLAAPLEAVRNVSGSIDWTVERIEAFENLKKLFEDNLTLQTIDWSKVIYLTTDASLSGVGAWIGQKNEEDQIVPVICASKKLSPTQQRWSATKRELWGLMWAMEKFRYYLLGRKFIARVDHRPLVAMMKNKLNVMMEGWVETILKYDFETVYLPGELNFMADALSRTSELQETSEVGSRKAEVEVEVEKLSNLTFEMEKRGKKLPSEEVQKSILESVHLLGHFSVEKMYKKIWNDGYWWPGLRSQLTEVVKSCTSCQRFNTVKEGYHPLQTISADMPMDHMEVDMIGPLPESSDGYTQILSVVDVFTGYVVIRALKSKSMEEVTTALWSIFCEYGTPKILQSDNGTEFVNQLIQQLTELYGIDHRLITAYHPRANGLVERQNKEISRGLKKRLEGAKDRWQEWIPMIQLGMNCKEISRTGSTPFSLMYGRKFNDFVDFTEVEDVEVSLERIQVRKVNIKSLQEVIFPSIVERNATFKGKVEEAT